MSAVESHRTTVADPPGVVVIALLLTWMSTAEFAFPLLEIESSSPVRLVYGRVLLLALHTQAQDVEDVVRAAHGGRDLRFADVLECRVQQSVPGGAREALDDAW